MHESDLAGSLLPWHRAELEGSRELKEQMGENKRHRKTGRLRWRQMARQRQPEEVHIELWTLFLLTKILIKALYEEWRWERNVLLHTMRQRLIKDKKPYIFFSELLQGEDLLSYPISSVFRHNPSPQLLPGSHTY